ncbi:hypothetical protein [Pelotomaculum propionicicum]|nr:hypothetical protein [Pelotomaculum propionicicum]
MSARVPAALAPATTSLPLYTPLPALSRPGFVGPCPRRHACQQNVSLV